MSDCFFYHEPIHESDSRAKILYNLTDKGIDLLPVLVEIILWSERHHTMHPLATEFALQLRQNKVRVIETLYADLKGKIAS